MPCSRILQDLALKLCQLQLILRQKLVRRMEATYGSHTFWVSDPAHKGQFPLQIHAMPKKCLPLLILMGSGSLCEKLGHSWLCQKGSEN